MKIILRVLLIISFLLIGAYTFDSFFEQIAAHFIQNGYAISLTSISEHLTTLSLYAVLWGTIPTIYWISHKFVTYKYKYFEIIGHLLSILLGLFFVTVKAISVAPIRTMLPDVEIRIAFSSLKINQYFFMGITFGFIIFLLLGRLFKLIEINYFKIRKNKTIQRELDEIGRN